MWFCPKPASQTLQVWNLRPPAYLADQLFDETEDQLRLVIKGSSSGETMLTPASPQRSPQTYRCHSVSFRDNLHDRVKSTVHLIADEAIK